MRSRWFHRPLLHSPTTSPEKKVTWLELFYDLIFVAAFIQLGNGLSDNVGMGGVLTFVAAFLPLWVAWTGFTFFENRYTVDDFVHRSLVLLQMFAVAGMGIAASGIAEHGTMAFSIAAGVAHLVIAVMYVRTYLHLDAARDYTAYWGFAFALAGVAWLAAGMLPSFVSYPVWAIATLVILIAPLSQRSISMNERYPIDFEHLSERYGLLTIIVLGESFVKVLTSLVVDAASFHLFVEAGVALLITCGVWWVYFDDVAGSRIRPGRGQWIVWFYSHIPLQIGVTAVAVGIKKAIHFSWTEPAPEKYRWLLAGALALVYFSVAAIDSVTERRQAELSDKARVTARWLSGVLLLVLAPAGYTMSGWTFLVLVLAVNAGQVLFDMMMAPFEQSEAAEQGKQSLAELHRATLESERTQPRARPRALSQAVRKGAPSSVRADLYAYFMSGSWPRVFVAFAFVFVAANVFFAALYTLQPGAISGARPDSFLDAFFFSIQTMSTIGYGALSPGSEYGNVIVTAQAATGIIGVAIVTGLVFAKASRPTAGVLFSDVMVVSMLNQQLTLTFRVGNARGNEIVDARVQVVVLKDEVSPEGQHLRRLHDLELVRSNSPLFALGWNVMHVIDDKSPLADVDWTDPDRSLTLITVTLTGHDSTYGQQTYARHQYRGSDIRVGHRFVDVMSQLEDGRLMVDYGRFHDTFEVEAVGGSRALEEVTATPST